MPNGLNPIDRIRRSIEGNRAITIFIYAYNGIRGNFGKGCAHGEAVETPFQVPERLRQSLR